MPRIAIVTDSTASFPQKWIDQYHVSVAPLKIHWGSETYLDGIDMTPGMFYEKLSHSKSLPTTSQPARQDFIKLFENLAEQSDGIIVPLISSGISGTVESAQAAAHELSHLPIEIVDTRISSMGMVLIILAAARAIDEGKSLPEVKEIAEKVVRKLHTFFAVDSLKYLHMGGRINGASWYLGSALDIKPILYFNEEGKIDALDRVRTKRKALQRLIALVEEHAKGKAVHIGIVHANSADVAEEFRNDVLQRVNCIEEFIIEMSPVIGTHVGPGTIGISVYTDAD